MAPASPHDERGDQPPPILAVGVGHSPRVRSLIVDSNEWAASALMRDLEWRGHLVTLAFSGESALELLEGCSQPALNGFDQAYLSYRLPGISGYDVLEFIRSRSTLAGIWVVLMVSDQADLVELEAKPYHADLYLTEKPV